jgi:hypothetical protein
MQRATAALFVLSLLVAAPSLAAAQPNAIARSPYGGLARLIVGVDVINLQIAELRRELARCDGGNRTGACASRALLQAKLNYLLSIAMAYGDPDTAGAPPRPLTKPAESSDYDSELAYLNQQLAQERSGNYLLSENRARWWIIQSCKALKDLSRLRIAFMTAEEGKDIGGPKTKAAVTACIAEYDAKAVMANRKMAMEYCVPATTDPNGGRRLMNLCMHKHDMLTAMCKQQMELDEAWSRHKYPQQARAAQVCPLDRIVITAQETEAIKAAPPVRTMAELPPKFFAPPDVVIPPKPPLPIPAGTVIEVRIQGSWDGIAIDAVANDGQIIQSILDQPLVIGGKEILARYSGVFLKGRILGTSEVGARPATVQIGLTTDEVTMGSTGARADLKSNELVFTVPYRSNANNPGVMFDTRMRFTIGGSGTVAMPSAQVPASPPPRTVPSPAAPTAPPLSPQSQAEDAARRGERIQACMMKALKDYPSGGAAQAQAIAACAQTK